MLSLEEKIGQLVMVGFPGLEPPEYILNWLAEGRIGGVILFARNVESPAQLARLTQACHNAARHPILISIDQEGGTVSRLREVFTESPGAMALGAAHSEAIAENMAYVLGKELRALGINWNYAPVLDVTHDTQNPSVGTRSISDDKALVSRIGSAQIRGYQKAGVAATGKHFPGLGNTPVDTHLAMARISSSVEELWDDDLIPFRDAITAGVASMMITHVTFDALDPERPGTLSPAVVQHFLRERMGFNGVVATDCLEMKAITDHYSSAESAILSIMAGGDIALVSHTPSRQNEAYEGLLEAARSGQLPMEQVDASVARVQAMKAQFAITETPDPASIMEASDVKTAEETARAALVLLHSENGLLPLPTGNGKRIAAVEFASFAESIAVEKGGNTGFEKLLRQHLPTVESIALRIDTVGGEAMQQAKALAQNSDILVVATRSAHLTPDQKSSATELLKLAKRSVLVCLRNPYDVNVLPDANAVLCTFGDSTPSLHAAVDALRGEFTPSGQLPVHLSN